MHKAISIIQFKLEYEVISKRPEFNMGHRCLLDKINFEKGTIVLNNKEYSLKDNNFPTIDPNNPYKLTKKRIIEKLKYSFMNSDKLQTYWIFILKRKYLFNL